MVFLTCVFFVGTVAASVLAVKANKDTSIDVQTGRMLVKNSDLPVTMHSQGISINANEKATPDGGVMCASLGDIAKMYDGFSVGSQVRLHLNPSVDSEDEDMSEGVVMAPQESTSYYNDTHIVIGGITFDISPENPCSEDHDHRALEVYGGKHRKLFRDVLDLHRSQRQLNHEPWGKLSGAGDELQGIKRGIIEMADAIIINKADGNNRTAAKLAKAAFNRALHFYPVKASGWMPKVEVCSAIENKGIDVAWKLITAYITHTKEGGYFSKKRQDQNNFWLLQSIEDQLKDKFFQDETIAKELKTQMALITANKRSPFVAAEYLLNLYKSRV